MDNDLVFLDPTDEQEPLGRQLATRPPDLKGTIGIVDISKPRGDVFCDELETLFRTTNPSLKIARLKKPTFTKPAPDDLRNEVAERCTAVIQALAD